MQVQVFVKSARDLKNVNWRNGLLTPYAVVWIDTSGKCSTKVDLDNGVHPVWNEKFTIPLRSTSHPDTAVLYIDVVHANASPNTKPLVGSVQLPLRAALKEARANGKAARSLDLIRPSGRPQGIVEIKIGVKDQNISPRDQHGQQVPLNNRPMSPWIEPQPRVQYRPQVQPQPQARFHHQHQQPQQSQLPQPQAQFHHQPQQQFHPSPRPTAQIYRPGYRPTGPSAMQQGCNLGPNMAFGGGPVQQIMRQMVAVSYQNALPANNNNAALVNGEACVIGEPIDGGLAGNGFDLGGQFDNGSGADLNGYGADLNGMGNGSGTDLSGFDNGSGIDSCGMVGDGVDFSGSMDGGGVDYGGFMGGGGVDDGGSDLSG